MEISTIKGDEVVLMYYPSGIRDERVEVGNQYAITEKADPTSGIVVQVINNDSLDYPGLQQQLMQTILAEQSTSVFEIINRERGMDSLKGIKLATAKIRKRILQTKWQGWDGWIPTRNVDINLIAPDQLISNVVTTDGHLQVNFCSYKGVGLSISGPKLNMVNVVTGVKGSGKSHITKHLALELARLGVPCIIFDVNGEYTKLRDNQGHASQVLRWGEDFRLDLEQAGWDVLRTAVDVVAGGLPDTSRAAFENALPVVFEQRKARIESERLAGQGSIMDVDYFAAYNWTGGDLVKGAIQGRLDMIKRRHLFKGREDGSNVASDFYNMYNKAAAGQPIVFDMRSLSTRLQRALVTTVNRIIEDICKRELEVGTGRYPFVFFEEAHLYVSEEAILNIITRGRHIGIASVFVTNTPQKLPETVFRQLDNLFLLALTHKDDIRSVSNSSFTDQETIQSFATRMPAHNALIVGNITDRYPLVVKVEPLPEGVPTSGETRSTWDRFLVANNNGSVSTTPTQEPSSPPRADNNSPDFPTGDVGYELGDMLDDDEIPF